MSETNTPKEHGDEFTHEVAQNVQKKLKLTKRGAGAIGLATGLAIGLGGPEIVDNLNGPEFHGSIEYTVQQGDTLYDIVETIDGHEQADPRDVIAKILSDPANTGISADLQPGQVITIPIEIER